MSDFAPFPKMARLSRECIITEKIDGTNAQVLIEDVGSAPVLTDRPKSIHVADPNGERFLALTAGSRKRWITPDDDNFGFARWVHENAAEIALLGPGRHFGEWWGSGIQRGYGLPKGEKRWSLFNVSRWHTGWEEPREFRSVDPRQPPRFTVALPQLLSTVPVLGRGEFDTGEVLEVIERLERYGSAAAPGFMRPEGVVVFHLAGNVGFKKTLGRDGLPKSLAKGGAL